MNQQEAESLFQQLFVAFPGYREWLKRTGSPNETYEVWCKMLSRVPQPAGAMAVDLMIDGERKMPEAYERDQLPLLLKSYALRIDQDERKRRFAAEQRQSRQSAADARSGADERFEMKMGTAYRKLLALGSQCRDGVIDEDARREEADRIIKLAMTPRGRASA